ncbi:hypothetical protein M5E87_05215 [Flavonifractor plautii]|nr:hypothetical protein M5E87_05215 [Flavonifractor plautii]
MPAAHHRGGGGRPHLLRGHRLSGGRPAAPSGLCRRPPPAGGGAPRGTGAQLPAPGVPGSAYRPRLRGRLSNRVDFYNTYQQEAQRLGRCAFLPNHLRNAARDWTHGAPEYDCLVLTVSPMDKHGCFSLAGSACIELEVLPAPGGWWWRWPPVLPGSSGT